MVVVNRLSRPVVILDGLPGLYGFKYDSATACGTPLYLYSYKLVGSATLWAPPKNCSTKGEGFGLKSFGGEVVEGKKILFHTFLSFNGWLVSN